MVDLEVAAPQGCTGSTPFGDSRVRTSSAVLTRAMQRIVPFVTAPRVVSVPITTDERAARCKALLRGRERPHTLGPMALL